MTYCKLLLVLLFSCFSLQAYAGTSFNQIVFFGDSLSDNGNLFSADYNIMPSSPPYFNGRFSNGPTWAEKVAKNYADLFHVSALNYAVGGETTNYFNSDDFLNFYLDISVCEYYLENVFSNKSKTLFVIWIGGNDYSHGNPANLAKLSTDTVNKIQDTINDLIDHGGRYFLVLNLPDMGKSPAAKANGAGAYFTQASIMHNTKLQTAMTNLKNSHSNVNIQLYDVNSLFANLVTNTDFYNQKYATHLNNLTDACWVGGYYLQATAMQEDEIAKQLEKVYDERVSTPGMRAANLSAVINFKAMAHQIATNKPLSVAYSVSQSYALGATACADPDAYAFWDGIHPSKVVHQILGSEAISFIDQAFAQN